jgi:hypothetical protein
MKYEKPDITLLAEATDIVRGPKLGGLMDSRQPQNPIHSSAAYESDE